MNTSISDSWLALVVGNTRSHWGYFCRERFVGGWHTAHLTRGEIALWVEAQFQTGLIDRPVSPDCLWIVSVVPQQTRLWLEAVPEAWFVARSHLPLENLYPTLGLDRAITLLGAGVTVGWPVLVIDGGTALTFTAGISSEQGQGALYGGAILPGLRLQSESLRQGTAALAPFVQEPAKTADDSEVISELPDLPTGLPTRWATDSVGAIASGLSYSLSATLTDYLHDWWNRFPDGHAVMTGGDGPQLHHLLQQRTPEIASRVQINPNVMFYGMDAYRQLLIGG